MKGPPKRTQPLLQTPNEAAQLSLLAEMHQLKEDVEYHEDAAREGGKKFKLLNQTFKLLK